MYFPIPDFRTTPGVERPPEVMLVARSDAQWSRPIFKAPPLELPPAVWDAAQLAEELRRIGPFVR